MDEYQIRLVWGSSDQIWSVTQCLWGLRVISRDFGARPTRQRQFSLVPERLRWSNRVVQEINHCAQTRFCNDRRVTFLLAAVTFLWSPIAHIRTSASKHCIGFDGNVFYQGIQKDLGIMIFTASLLWWSWQGGFLKFGGFLYTYQIGAVFANIVGLTKALNDWKFN